MLVGSRIGIWGGDGLLAYSSGISSVWPAHSSVPSMTRGLAATTTTDEGFPSGWRTCITSLETDLGTAGVDVAGSGNRGWDGGTMGRCVGRLLGFVASVSRTASVSSWKFSTVQADWLLESVLSGSGRDVSSQHLLWPYTLFAIAGPDKHTNLPTAS